MAEPKNLTAIREWVKINRPDIHPNMDTYVEQDAFILLLSIGFEAGRKFQHDNSELPLKPVNY